VSYYTNAGIYLGLIEKVKKYSPTKKKLFIYYRLTKIGKKIMQMDLKKRCFALSRDKFYNMKRSIK